MMKFLIIRGNKSNTYTLSSFALHEIRNMSLHIIIAFIFHQMCHSEYRSIE